MSQIQETLWDSSVSVEVHLARSDWTDEIEPLPLLIQLRRVAYLPFYSDRIALHFGFEGSSEVWFEGASGPLQWHMPIGALYDHALVHPESRVAEGTLWKIYLHVSHWPTQSLLPYSGIDDLRVIFISQLKEGIFMCNQSSKLFSELQAHQIEQMWRSLRDGDKSSFWVINNKLRPSDPAGRYLPFRLTCVGSGRVVQRLLPLCSEDGAATTVSALETLVEGNNKELYTAGIAVPSGCELAWLYSKASYADNFLYIFVK
eukprot:Clim_evm62s150 gene=Clim_evmTU62s150